ncbi:MAG: cyclic nucleotide-binding domain-containing protein, partial [Desulfobulbus sp.]
MRGKKEIIAESLLFSGLPPEQLDKVTAIAVERAVGRGESIFFEGDPGDGFYMVAEGQVKIFKMSL